MCWIKVEDKMPTENTWVIGLCKLTHEVNKDHAPVVFQVKYQKEKGWSDWCGDIEEDTDWRVIAWLPLPPADPLINMELMEKVSKAVCGEGTFPPEFQKHLTENFWSLL